MHEKGWAVLSVRVGLAHSSHTRAAPTSMCCPDPSELPAVRSLRLWVSGQLCIEIVLLVLSSATVRDGGYLGVGSSIFSMVGCIALLGRCVGLAFTLRLFLVASTLASLLNLAQMGLCIQLLATVEDWCCTLNNTSLTGMRALLAVLICLYCGGVVLRTLVICGPLASARKAVAITQGVVPVAASSGSSVAMGVPVAHVVTR